MRKLFKKEFHIVIVDGNDERIIRTITESINIVTKERYGKAICRPFNSTHDSIKVISFCTSSRTYETVCRMIKKAYPNLCVINTMM